VPDFLTSAAIALRSELDALLAAPVLRSAEEPLAALRAALSIQAAASELLGAAVERARSTGSTWQQIGDALGTSRQAAFQRFGRPIDPRTGGPMSTTPLPDAERLSETVIADLAAARWDRVAERFDATVAERLTAEGLGAAWAQVIGSVGSYEDHGTPETARAADFTVSNTVLRFEAGDMVLRLSFRDDRTIAGLFVLPPEATR
jgi:hypothetical protein